MDEREFARQIGAAWTLLKDVLGIGRFLISKSSIQVDEVFRDVSLSPDSSYEEIFKTGLSRSNYNILSEDYAYFQFGRSGETSWRLGYFPNPWLSGVPSAGDQLRHWETLEEIGALTHEDVSDLLEEMPYKGAVPPVRFEYAPEQYRELAHPAAHFHIGRDDANRWPSALALGPVAFVLLIAKMYYPTAWAKCSKFHDAPVTDCIDEKFLGSLGDVRAVHEFSERERRGLHFGRNMVPITAPRARSSRP
jgi:hypothetical protein